jgi:hypothetical protein
MEKKTSIFEDILDGASNFLYCKARVNFSLKEYEV